MITDRPTPEAPAVAWHAVFRWLEADWARPFLTEVGVPAELVEDLDALLLAVPDLGGPTIGALTHDPGDPAALAMASRFLDNIGARHGSITRETFRDWVDHCVGVEAFTEAALTWLIVLRCWIGMGKPTLATPAPPAAAVRLADRLRPLLDLRALRRLHHQLERAAPPGDSDLGGFNLDVEGLRRAAANYRTWQALELLRGPLTLREQAALVTAAAGTARALGLPSRELSPRSDQPHGRPLL